MAGTRYPEINRNISRYLRKSDEFPDFKDILEIITETNEHAGLHMSEEHVSRMSMISYILFHNIIEIIVRMQNFSIISKGGFRGGWR